jgi:hypothetical protein
MKMKAPKLTRDQQECLRAQVIDAERPGPVLHDFGVVLDYVGTEGVKAAGKYNLLPLSAIGELNPRLGRPLLLDLQRPQLRSHPYLHGLHLLLRASGLSRVEGTGERARLVLDPAVHSRWNALNLTEQYFTLLEAWLRFGKRELIGERGGSFDNPLLDCVQAWRYLPAQGRRFDLRRPAEARYYGVGRDIYHLALMDLFGLLRVDHPGRPIQPWAPAGLGHLPFGDAVFTLLDRGEALYFDEEPSPGEARFGAWQPLFQPYFPEWRENLTFPKTKARKGVFVFRVALGKVWRRIAVPAGATLDTLVGSILDSVDFDDDHLYEFITRNAFGATVRYCHPYMDEGPFTDEVRVGQLSLEPGQSMTLVYDFGDDWRFDVKLERIEPPRAGLKAPKGLESHGKAPRQYTNWDEEE